MKTKIEVLNVEKERLKVEKEELKVEMKELKGKVNGFSKELAKQEKATATVIENPIHSLNKKIDRMDDQIALINALILENKKQITLKKKQITQINALILQGTHHFSFNANFSQID